MIPKSPGYNGRMRMVRPFIAAAGALLVAFHGWLLASQFLQGELAEPWLLLRWALAAGLATSLVVLRRRGHSLVSRQAVAVWVLAALLHGPAVVADYGGALQNLAVPETAATVVLKIVAASAALVLTLTLLGAALARRTRHTLNLRLLAFGFHPTGALAGAFSPPFSPRPPPLS